MDASRSAAGLLAASFLFSLLTAPPCLGAARGVAPLQAQDATPAAVPNAPVESVLAVEQEWLLAMRRGDTVALRRLLGSDHLHVGSDGRLRHKAELLQALQRRQVRYLTYDIDSYDIRVAGNTGIVSGAFHTIVVTDGIRRTLQGRYLRVWLRDETGWRLMAHQITETKPGG